MADETYRRNACRGAGCARVVDPTVNGIKGRKLTLAILTEWAGEAQKNGIQPVILFLPDRDALERRRAESGGGGDFPDIWLEPFAASNGILWVNAVQPFLQHQNMIALYLEDGHPSPEGHAFLAPIIFSALREAGQLCSGGGTE